MYDTIETLSRSIIQHGKNNDRIYLMKLAKADSENIVERLESLAQKKKYSKIFAKVPTWAIAHFQNDSYVKEAFIPRFYNGDTGAYFLAKYLDRSRRRVPETEEKEIRRIIELATAKQKTATPPITNRSFTLRRLETPDIDALTSLYKKVFKSYPFPIHDADYIRQTMKDHIIYFGAFAGERLVAASSAETDKSALNVEMTDFATHPDERGQSLSLLLLRAMEKELASRGFKTAFTIARALSPGMNITFAKNGYEYAGTLTNNTNIAGSIESMNVWYKKLES